MAELRIQEILKQKGMTQIQMARRMHIGPVALSRMITRGKPSFENLERMASALDCEVADLFVRQSTTITCPYCGRDITIKTEG